jgi:hypothetical protein
MEKPAGTVPMMRDGKAGRNRSLAILNTQPFDIHLP